MQRHHMMWMTFVQRHSIGLWEALEGSEHAALRGGSACTWGTGLGMATRLRPAMQDDRRSAFLASRRKSSSLARFCFSSCRIHLVPHTALDAAFTHAVVTMDAPQLHARGPDVVSQLAPQPFCARAYFA